MEQKKKTFVSKKQQQENNEQAIQELQLSYERLCTKVKQDIDSHKIIKKTFINYKKNFEKLYKSQSDNLQKMSNDSDAYFYTEQKKLKSQYLKVKRKAIEKQIKEEEEKIKQHWQKLKEEREERERLWNKPTSQSNSRQSSIASTSSPLKSRSGSRRSTRKKKSTKLLKNQSQQLDKNGSGKISDQNEQQQQKEQKEKDDKLKKDIEKQQDDDPFKSLNVNQQEQEKDKDKKDEDYKPIFQIKKEDVKNDVLIPEIINELIRVYQQDLDSKRQSILFMENNFSSIINQWTNKAKAVKQEFHVYQKKKRQEANRFSHLISNTNFNNQKDLLDEYEASQKESSSKEQTTTQHTQDYIVERQQDLKYLLLHFLNQKIKHHTQALHQWSNFDEILKQVERDKNTRKQIEKMLQPLKNQRDKDFDEEEDEEDEENQQDEDKFQNQ